MDPEIAACVRSASSNGRTASSAPWMIRVGTRTPARSPAADDREPHSTVLRMRTPRGALGGRGPASPFERARDKHLGRGAESPRDGVLSGLRGVRLGIHLAHEEFAGGAEV